ncbi:hypothetical protein KAFR_0I01120 [Kazachstania africana CBS 2517]|uniref:Man1/Src1 C-terminal domain-containing protein n=1 Tax=Kazachstania africana (strain ATCC 22294 / BCRC 22015 / CBS 2517 / CECT 1963 / NBRC 1671 / NRRL Y-8276) TaxID=1071382 RepID=H2AZU3_KAZAF|nr:hypothetical protein KAFR_0I01120 [Kazachstania africana CBS 2517]CCF59893.1 hypothetical protein KAFR_0I01120 [Kazachstania africana CBS 2517]
MDYLEPRFDPNNSKVADLRRILFENNVVFPTKAKKSTLVGLFEEEVRPKISSLRKKHKNVKPSSEGIVNASSASSSLPERKKRTRETKNKEEKVDEDGDVKMEETTPSKSRESRNRKKRKTGERSRTSSPVKRESKASVKSSPTKSESKSLIMEKPEESEKTFEQRTPRATRSLKTEGVAATEPSPSKGRKRSNRSVIDTSNLNISEELPRRLRSADTKKTEPSKEKEMAAAAFSEQLEESMPQIIPTSFQQKCHAKLEKMRKIMSCQKVQPFAKMMAGNFKAYLIFSIIALPILFALWYREQRIRVGYCGKELPLIPLASGRTDNVFFQKIDSLLKFVKPKCLPCPSNAKCYSLMDMDCYPQFKRYSSIFKLNGLIPLTDYCIIDNTKEKLVNKMVNYMLKKLRSKNGSVDCGTAKSDLISGMIEDDLYDSIYEKFSNKYSDDEFEELWSEALDKLEDLKEIKISVTDIIGPDQMKIIRSTSKKSIGLKCRLGSPLLKNFRDVLSTCIKLRYVTAIIAIFGIISFFTFKYTRKCLTRRKLITFYTEKAIEKLKKAKRTRNNSSGLDTLQIRDDVLSEVTNLKDKNYFWSQMMKRMDADEKNIASTQIEVHGEIIKYWNWIGNDN